MFHLIGKLYYSLITLKQQEPACHLPQPSLGVLQLVGFSVHEHGMIIISVLFKTLGNVLLILFTQWHFLWFVKFVRLGDIKQFN